MRRAVFGARSRSARIAPLVVSRARSSSTWPSRTRTVITAAASKIDRHRAVRAAHGCREQLGGERRDHAVEPGDPGAHRDQGEHVRSEEHTSELQSLMRLSYAVFCCKK